MHQGLARAVAVIAAVFTMAFVAACGDDSGDDSGGNASGGGGSGESSVVEEAKANVEEGLKPQSTWQGPESAPEPATNKTVYVISCSPDTEGCQRDVRAAVDAAETIGWDAERLDSDGTPANFVSLMNQAINSGADGIIDASFPVEAIEPALRRAEAQGIPVVSMLSGNDPDQGVGPDGGFFTEVDTSAEQQGHLAADWIIAQTDGEAKIGLINEPAFPIQNQRVDAFKSYDLWQQCEGCELVEEIDIPVANLASDATPAIQNFLRANPDVNYFWATYDGAGVFAVQAINEAGLKGDVPVVGVDGNSPNLEFIADDNVQVASIVSPHEWIGWAAVDQMNRAFNGEPPAPEWEPDGGGIPTKILDKSNLPEGANFTGDLDFEAKFEELWGR